MSPLEENKSLLKVDLRVLVDLVSRLPRLELLGCKLLGAGSGWTTYYPSRAIRYIAQDWAGPYRDSRNDFAKAIKTTALPLTLREARLDFLHPLFDTSTGSIRPEKCLV